MSKKRNNVLLMAQFSMLLAIEAIFCFTPLGSLPAIGPIVATLAAVPVIITAIVLGPLMGTIMGFFTGLFSFLVWTFMPPSPMGFIFTPFYSVGDIQGNYWSLVICFVPRILIGTTAGVLFHFLSRKEWKSKGQEARAYLLSGFAGSMINTLLVLGGTYLFFGRDFAQTLGKAYEVILGVIGLQVLTSGIPEAIVGAIAAYGICRPLRRHMLHRA